MKSKDKMKVNNRLKHERMLRGWTQADVAGHIGTDGYTVNRWERGRSTPSLIFQQKLCTIFGKSFEELGLLVESPLAESKDSLMHIWHVPFRRNPFFVGREDILAEIHTRFQKDEEALSKFLQAISGLGGIGKTQIALEYAYRYASQYNAIFWIQADSQDTLLTECLRLAEIVCPTEKNKQDYHHLVMAIQRWFKKNTQWLLIIDNVEDLEIINDLLPTLLTGHVLFTTRIQILGTIAQQVFVEKMTIEEGALFVLRRAKLIDLDTTPECISSTDYQAATTLAQVMDGLPLALDQASAYIEEVGCGIPEYLEHYQKQKALLLSIRGTHLKQHPMSVTTTFSLAIEKIAQIHPIGPIFLQFFAFLQPDTIPEELISLEVMSRTHRLKTEIFDSLTIHNIVRELRRFSLLHRHSHTKMLILHRLVQEVIKESMSEGEQRQWAEDIINIMSSLFPEGNFSTWQASERFLPQAVVSASLISQWNIRSPEAANLLDRIGTYFLEQTQFNYAEQHLLLSLSMREQILETDHIDRSHSLAHVATLYYAQGKYSEAEPLFLRSLAIQEQILGKMHPSIARVLDNLANLYNEQNNYALAEPLLLRALHIYEQTSVRESPEVARCYKDLANLYDNQGKFNQSEPLYMKALEIYEKAHGPIHPEVAMCLNDIGWLYEAQGKYAQAESLLQRSLAIRKQVLNPDHADIAVSLNLLAWLYTAQGRYTQAEEFYNQVLTMRLRSLGPDHADIAATYNQFAELHRMQKNYDQAESMHTKALQLRERVLGNDHRETAQSLNNLARTYTAQGKYKQAENLYRRAIDIRKRTLSPTHLSVAISLNDLAELLTIQKLYEEAGQLYQQALNIIEKSVGLQHIHAATSYHGLAYLYYCQNKYDQSEPFYQQALTLREKILGPDHPDVGQCLKNYILLLQKTNRKSVAKDLTVRVHEISSKYAQ